MTREQHLELPPVVITASYDHQRLATLAYLQVKELIDKAPENIQLDTYFSTFRGVGYFNVLMSSGLGEDLERQVKLVLFRNGRRYNMDSHFNEKLRKEWRLFIQGSTK